MKRDPLTVIGPLLPDIKAAIERGAADHESKPLSFNTELYYDPEDCDDDPELLIRYFISGPRGLSDLFDVDVAIIQAYSELLDTLDDRLSEYIRDTVIMSIDYDPWDME